MTKPSAHSYTTLAGALMEGDSIARSRRYDITEKNFEKPAAILEAMRNTMSQTRKRAIERTGKDYRMDSGSFMLPSTDAIMLVVTLTCTGDAAVDDI